MDKKIFGVYLAKDGVPNNEAYAKLDLPASPWELWDALDKVRLQTDDILYMEIEDYYAFEYGYVCELQEPSCIANPGVLVGLNSLLDNCQVITLPTGERVQRHPDTNLLKRPGYERKEQAGIPWDKGRSNRAKILPLWALQTMTIP